MGNIPSAKQSPRIENGVLKWYAGDTFSLQMELELEDQDGEPVILTSTDTVKVSFYNECRENVKTFEFTDVQSNTVTLEFDATVTALFSKGRYIYFVSVQREERTTVAAYNDAVVE